ncbi:HAD hydrolase-like protein [Ferrimonas lipolytica]|uniref:phosphoglycolate phosphatase n=1 Tax=Ferrimonas lipolytica TaxID=2724191 RepID=A0A6H1UJT3_9GAMM|nr:HAD hydrolase-like protein [Ferrimonas lipolytica]QIZ78573.1 HAD hydrolase-like protein [Ferrimonas lipolytica]
MQLSFSAWPAPSHSSLKYVVVMARYQGQWILSRHHQRQSWDIPGGKIDAGETAEQAAARELVEETGASQFTLEPIELYHVTDNAGHSASGLLCVAEISELGPLPIGSEMAEIQQVGAAPNATQFTHPLIQPHLFAQVELRMALLQRLKSYKHVVWDWNGTLVDDAPLAVDIVNQMLTKQQLPTTTLEHYRDQFCHPVSDYYAAAGFDFDRISFDEICSYFGKAYQANRDKLQLHPGCLFLLRQLATDHRQSILSAASQSSLEHCLEHHQITPLFDSVFGLDNHHAVSKVERGHELLTLAKIAKSDTIMIGDTDHDLEVAHALGIDCLLIACGHQSTATLRQLHTQVLPNWHAQIHN